MVSDNKFLLMLAIFAVVFVSANFVSAITELNLSYFADFNNYTLTLNIFCNTSINSTGIDAINGTGNNITIYYNITGENTGFATGAPSAADPGNATALITIQNTTTDQGDFISNGVSITGLAEGLFAYNFSCMADNGTDQEFSYGSANITIINTPAGINVTGLNGTDMFTGFLLYNVSYTNKTDVETGILLRQNMLNNYANVSGNFSIDANVNISVGGVYSDEFGYLDSVYFNLSLSGVQKLFWQAGNTRDLYNFTIDTLGFDNGTDNATYEDGFQTYSLCIYANDTLGNINFTECYSVLTIDNNAPSVSLSQVTADTTTDSIKLTIAPGESGAGLNGDCSTNKGTVSGLSITHSNLDCGTSYSFTVSCTDYMNLAGSATTSFSTNDCSGGTGGGGGGTSTVTGTTYSATSDQLTAGYTKQISANDQIKFIIGTASHSIKATSVAADKVTITISSTPQTATLNTGDTRNFDLDADEVYDVEVKLNSITSGKADLTVKKISLAVTPESEAEEAAKEAGATGTTEKAEKPSSLLWLWIVLAVIIIIVVVYFVMKKRK